VGESRSRQGTRRLLTFAVAAGPAIPPPVRAALGDPRPPDLPFRAVHHLLWSNPSGTVVFAGWQDDVDLGMGGRWHHSGEGLTAFTGHVWPRSGPWPSGRWAACLADHLDTSGVDDLLGVFTAISLDADGKGIVTSDSLGTSLTYRAQVGDVGVVSSRARLVARICADGTPRRDPLGAGWLPFCGFPMGSRTGYEGVEVVPLGVCIEVSPAGIELRPATPSWRQPLEGDPQALLDGVYADAVTSIHAALGFPVERKVAELTGGKDTRLIFAILLAEGLEDQFEYRTWGDADLPDVVVARELTKMHGLRHDVGHEPARRQRAAKRRRRLAAAYPELSSRERQLRLNVGAWDGMRNAYELEAAQPPCGDRVALNGTYGEAFSSNYLLTNWHRNHADLRQTLLVHMQLGAAGIFRPEVLQHYRNELIAAAYECCSLEDAPQDVIDSMYLRHKARRWFGSTQETDENNHVLPLHSPFGVRLGFALGARERRRQWIYRELYRRTCPALTEMPFTSKPWPEVEVPDRQPEPTKPLALRPVRQRSSRRSPARTAAGELRRRSTSEDVEVMRRFLLDEPSNPVFDLLERTRVKAAVTDFDGLTEPSKKQLYGALTAAIWLGGHEITL
jgi:hypothetical protein